MRLIRALALTALAGFGPALGAAFARGAPSVDTTLARARDAGPDLRWSRATTPAGGAPSAIGAYANGCLRGAVPLPETGGPWVVMRPSRRRYFGHPALVAFVGRLANAAQARKLSPIFVGDLSQPRGGPTLTGHASHQTGLDADVEFVPPRAPAAGPFSTEEREKLPAHAIVDLATSKLTPSFAPGALQLVELAARDPAVSRVFVNAAIKRKLCDTLGPKEREAWLGRVRPWWGHHDHFHVRLRCPEGNAACEDQPALPSGDGCDASLAWWFTAEAKAAPAKKEEPPPLPALCAELATPGP